MAALQGRLYLRRAYLAAANDPTTAVIAGTSERSAAEAQGGQFRQYAGGVTKLVRGSSRSSAVGLTLKALSPTQVQQVRELAGVTCVFRDTYGRKMFGSFLSFAVKDIPHSGRVGDNSLLSDVTIQFTETTYTEGV